MSRGLGKLQQEILGALDAPKQEVLFRYRGGLYFPYNGKQYHKAKSHGRIFDLPQDLIDLRAVCRFMAERGERLDIYDHHSISNKFQVSFYRAVRSLIKRGHLERCDYRRDMPVRLVKRTASAHNVNT